MAQVKTYIAEASSKIYDTAQLKSKFISLNKKTPVKALSSELSKNGFKPLTGKSDYYGGSEKIKSSDGRTESMDFAFQSYSKASSKDAGAVGVITLKASTGES